MYAVFLSSGAISVAKIMFGPLYNDAITAVHRDQTGFAGTALPTEFLPSAPAMPAKIRHRQRQRQKNTQTHRATDTQRNKHREGTKMETTQHEPQTCLWT